MVVFVLLKLIGRGYGLVDMIAGPFASSVKKRVVQIYVGKLPCNGEVTIRMAVRYIEAGRGCFDEVGLD